MSAPSRRSGRPASPGSGRVLVKRARVRWDRLGRMAMLLVLVALAYLYLSAGLSLLSTWRESHRAGAQVKALEAQHHQLIAQHKALSSPGTVEAEARQLGMMFPGERTYIVRELPNN
ncbi:MAG TPA: septum formation initiator family protein [Solirubrobacteraceae bacterium]